MYTTRHHLWHNEETGEPAGESTDQLHWASNPICPKCGQPTEYWEGIIDQTWDGNNIHGWNWACATCRIGTEIHEVEDDERYY